MQMIRVEATFTQFVQKSPSWWNSTSGFAVPLDPNFRIATCFFSRVLPGGSRYAETIIYLDHYDTSSLTISVTQPWLYPRDWTSGVVIKGEFFLIGSV